MAHHSRSKSARGCLRFPCPRARRRRRLHTRGPCGGSAEQRSGWGADDVSGRGRRNVGGPTWWRKATVRWLLCGGGSRVALRGSLMWPAGPCRRGHAGPCACGKVGRRQFGEGRCTLSASSGAGGGASCGRAKRCRQQCFMAEWQLATAPHAEETVGLSGIEHVRRQPASSAHGGATSGWEPVRLWAGGASSGAVVAP